MNPRRSFAGSWCLVTAAESDLGRAIAVRMADEGASVLLTGRSLDQSEATAEAVALSILVSACIHRRNRFVQVSQILKAYRERPGG